MAIPVGDACGCAGVRVYGCAGVRVCGCAGVRVCDMFDLHERSSRFGGSLSKSFLCHIADEHGRVEVGGEIQRVMDVNVRIC
jgi:hypothetical protein